TRFSRDWSSDVCSSDLILRKLLASSPLAIAHTLDRLIARLEALRERREVSDTDLAAEIAEAEELDGDLLDEILADSETPPTDERSEERRVGKECRSRDK